MEAALNSIVAEIAKYPISPLLNHVKYLSNPENKVQSLKEEIRSLENAKQRVQHLVDDAERNGENIESEVDQWLTAVGEKIDDVKKLIIDHEREADKKCLVGFCPDLCARYKFSRNLEEEAKLVAKLLGKSNFDRRTVSYRVDPQDVIPFPIRDYEAFKSRATVLNGIMDALKDAKFSIIGVYGTGGIGKTTLVKEVTRQVKECKLFDSVVFAKVSQKPDVRDVQNEIADSLGMKLDEPSIGGRARQLREKLKKKKVLVVLDDIWARFDLDEVGIPSGDPSGDAHEGSKILLASRNRYVLTNMMDSQKNFPIGFLTEEEAWGLFQKFAGDCIQSCDDLLPTAIEIANKCAGLPIAIATVARALKNKSLAEWRMALLELERPSPERFIEGTTTAEGYTAIELSYNYLQSEQDKMTFLLCSLISPYGSIEDLMRYTMGLGLYNSINKINEARDKVLSVVKKLKASCLLLDSYDDERFDIHDVVRDVALSIASRDNRMFVQKNDGELKKWPSEENMHKCEMIVLHHPDISTTLPDQLECPNLSFFFMHRDDSAKIPAGFFTQTKGLKVLNLEGIVLSNLSVSISFLPKLQMLCLDDCTLKDITVVGLLKNLEILSLARSNIVALPEELAQLTQLKLLDLSGCEKLKIIPPNVLSSLSKLEELYMDSFDGWEDKVVDKERKNASLEEMNGLSHLSTLYLNIPIDQEIPEWLLEKNLDRYKIFNGNDFDDFGFSVFEYSKMLKLQLYINISSSCAMKMLVKNAELLFLESLEGVKNVLGELNIGKDFPYLKKLYIQNGSDVEFITTEKIEFSQLEFMRLEDLPRLMGFCYEQNTSQQGEEGTVSKALPLFTKQYAFPQLKELELCCINVRRIWQSQLPEMSYWISNLTKLIISDCYKLEHLFSPCVARCLQQLKHFEIEECEGLQEIISIQEMEIEENKEIKAVICFPQLTSLKIQNLPDLNKFCSGNYTIEFPLLKKLKIKGCPELREFISSESEMQALFNQKVVIPDLGKMTLSELKNVKMIFQNEIVKGSFCKLEEMRVEDCGKLLTVFPSNISFGVFQNMKKLLVEGCNSLEMIFEVGEETLVVESQLKDLAIQFSSRLKQIWNRDPQGTLSFQSLNSVNVLGCERLQNVFPASLAKNLLQLENLRVVGCGVKEIVWEGLNSEEQLSSLTFKFPRLASLELEKLEQLKSLYGGRGKHAIVFDWPTLRKLETDYSTLVKMVSSQNQEMNEEAESVSHPFFFPQQVFVPKLEELCLSIFKDVESTPFPISLLQRFDSLESLQLFCWDLKYVDVFVDAVGTLSTITKLKLEQCQNMNLLLSSCFQNLTTLEVRWCEKMINLDTASSLSPSCFQNLTTLKVSWCDMMINLVKASSLSPSCFQNLTTLEVATCGMMINLVTVSVAQNLRQLTTMKISVCLKMTEIVAQEGDDEDGSTSIIFSKLKTIHLCHLENLTSFCGSLNYTFEFPSLEECIVERCRSMKVFCHRVLSTPCLHRVRVSMYYDDGHWAGELNTTIQQMYEVGYRNLNRLNLSDNCP